MRVELWTTTIGRIRCALDGIAMKSKKLGTENVSAGLDVAG